MAMFSWFRMIYAIPRILEADISVTKSLKFEPHQLTSMEQQHTFLPCIYAVNVWFMTFWDIDRKGLIDCNLLFYFFFLPVYVVAGYNFQ